MNNLLADSNTRAGTIGGALLPFLFNIQGLHLMETAITAAAGALVSFVMSVLCRKFLEWMEKKRRNLKT